MPMDIFSILDLSKLLMAKSGIKIKPENRGKFTDYCGGKVTDDCINKGKKSPDPAVRKRATFAANARLWKGKDGGSTSSILASLVSGSAIPEDYKVQDAQILYPGYKKEKQTEFTPPVFQPSWGAFEDAYATYYPPYEYSQYQRDQESQQSQADPEDNLESHNGPLLKSLSDEQISWADKIRASYKRAGVTSEIVLRLLVAQDALESNFGKSKFCKYTNNYGNIHASSKWTGAVINGDDKDADGKSYKTNFCKFTSMDDYTRYKWKLLNGKLYGINNNTSQEDFLTRIKKYAEDRQYTSKIQSLVKGLYPN